MPYAIKKAKGKDGYYVYGMDGKRHSKEPMELETAKKQMTALNIAHAKMDKGVIAPAKKERKSKVEKADAPAKKERKSKVVISPQVIAVPTKNEKKAIRSPVAKAKKVAKAVDAANKAMRPPMSVEMSPGLANTTLLNFRRKAE
jgi:hypothetical protein